MEHDQRKSLEIVGMPLLTHAEQAYRCENHVGNRPNKKKLEEIQRVLEIIERRAPHVFDFAPGRTFGVTSCTRFDAG